VYGESDQGFWARIVDDQGNVVAEGQDVVPNREEAMIQAQRLVRNLPDGPYDKLSAGFDIGAQALDLAMEQNELIRALESWEPKLTNLQEWISAVKKSDTWAGLKKIWDALWKTKEEVPSNDKALEEYKEFVELEPADGESLELAGQQAAPEYYYKEDAQQLVNTLKGVTIPMDAVEIDLMTYDPNEQVNVAVVWDNSGYTPVAGLLATWASPDEALQGAHELLEQWTIDYHTKHDDGVLEEYQQEWGDDWLGVMTEGWDGRVWTLPASEVMTILLANEDTQFAAENEMQSRRDLHGIEWEEPEEDEL
jgi:hypothetical protein